MSNAAIWRSDVLAAAVSSARAGQIRREESFDNRLDALKDVALTLLQAVDSLRSAQLPTRHGVKLQDEVQQFETELIRTALERTGGNQARAARLLGVKHTTLNAKIKRYKLRSDGYSEASLEAVGNSEVAA